MDRTGLESSMVTSYESNVDVLAKIATKPSKGKIFQFFHSSIGEIIYFASIQIFFKLL